MTIPCLVGDLGLSSERRVTDQGDSLKPCVCVIDRRRSCSSGLNGQPPEGRRLFFVPAMGGEQAQGVFSELPWVTDAAPLIEEPRL